MLRSDLSAIGTVFNSLGLLAGVAVLHFAAGCNKPQRSTAPVPNTGTTAKPAPAPGSELNVPNIRVAILKQVPAVDCTANFNAVLVTNSVKTTLPPGAYRIEATPGGLKLNGRMLDGSSIRLNSSSPSGYFKIDHQEVAPELIVWSQNGQLTVVAQLNLEEYLLGVLAGEVPYKQWHPEALKAQAIVSRSYALFQMKENRDKPFDVESTVMSQVFKPGMRNEPILQKAIESTFGLAVCHQGRLFPAYFHSTSGGQTAPADQVFKNNPSVQPLQGVNSPFCLQSPNATWQFSIGEADLRQKLRAGGNNLGTITNVRFVPISSSVPRASTVIVQHAQGQLELDANRFRLQVSARDLKSVWIERVDFAADRFTFYGRGYGHGVGLSQWGSQAMGQQGYNAAQILGFYFPGGELRKIYSDKVSMVK